MRHALLLLALLVTVAPELAHGCSCVIVLHPGEPLLANGRPVPTRQELDRYDAIFVGRVTGTASLPNDMPEGARYFMSGNVSQFQVERFWSKRDLPPITEVFSPAFGGACGHRFQSGDTFIVFARIHPGPVPAYPDRQATDVLTTDICTLTSPLPQAEDLLAVVVRLLGSGRYLVEKQGRNLTPACSGLAALATDARR